MMLPSRFAPFRLTPSKFALQEGRQLESYLLHLGDFRYLLPAGSSKLEPFMLAASRLAQTIFTPNIWAPLS